MDFEGSKLEVVVTMIEELEEGGKEGQAMNKLGQVLTPTSVMFAKKVRRSEARIDELKTKSLVTKTAHPRIFVQDTPPP